MKIGGKGDWVNWNLWKKEIVEIENCRDKKLWKIEVVENGYWGKRKLWKMQIVENANWGNRILEIVENVNCGKRIFVNGNCGKWKLRKWKSGKKDIVENGT